MCDLTYHRMAKLEGTTVDNLVQPQSNVNYELADAGDISIVWRVVDNKNAEEV